MITEEELKLLKYNSKNKEDYAKTVSVIVKKKDRRGEEYDCYIPRACSACNEPLKGTEKYCPECGRKIIL